MDEIVNDLLQLVSEKLGVDQNTIDLNASFFSLGVSSLLSEEVRLQLSKQYQNITPTLLFEQPNIYRLANYLVQQKNTKKISVKIDDNKKTTPLSNKLTQTDSGSTLNPDIEQPVNIAIIGIAGKFPQADSCTELWDNLLYNRDCIQEIPKHRWIYDRLFSTDQKQTNKIFSKWGGFIADVDRFDPLFFKISYKEAETLDPQQRLYLECCWQAMENAGYASHSPKWTPHVGVYAGVTWNEYSLLSHEQGYQKNLYKGPGSLYWGIPNRVSYFMNFDGPSIAIDTACSSSLVAVQLACQSIISGDCEIALAGGVNLNLHPQKYLFLSQNKFLSTEGKCRSFGESGDGYVPAEGVAVLVLKPLKTAVKDRDYIYGTIKGVSSNHGGKATGYTVPNPQAHSNLISASLKKANVQPKDISYIECHGTGTALGDPIEIRGLIEAHNNTPPVNTSTDKIKPYCGIGSVKSNIGHLEAAAGVAGIIKVLLSLRHEVIPASIHSSEINHKISLENTPFYIVKDNEEWQKNKDIPRVAAVSSFGAGGSNAHIIIESCDHLLTHQEHTNTVNCPGFELLVLSAQSEQQLKDYAKNILVFITKQLPILPDKARYTLKNIAGTLRLGREAFTKRLAIIADTLDDFAISLNNFSNNKSTLNIYSSDIKSASNDNIENSSTELSALRKYASEWVTNTISANDLPVTGSYLSVPLPEYPFLREKCWIAQDLPLTQSIINTNTPTIHPLVDNNISNLKQCSFLKLFHIEEFILKDHLVGGRNVIPGVCHLEMANICGQIAIDAQAVQLEEIWFHQVIAVDKQRRIKIDIEPLDDQYYTYIIKDEQDGNIVFSKGKFSKTTASKPKSHPATSIKSIKKNCVEQISVDKAYKRFIDINIIQKRSFQVIKNICFNKYEILCKLEIPVNIEKDFPQYQWHPVLMDGAVQTAMLHQLHYHPDIDTIVPFHFGQVTPIQALEKITYAHAVLKNAKAKKYSIHLLNQKGEVALIFNDFILREFKGHDQSKHSKYNPTEKNISNANKLPTYKINNFYVYKPTYINIPIDQKSTLPTNTYLIFSDSDNNIYDNFKNICKKKTYIIKIHTSNNYHKHSPFYYTINPLLEAEYTKLLSSIKHDKPSAHKNITIIIAWDTTETANTFDSIQRIYLLINSLFATIQQCKLLFVINSDTPQINALPAFFKSLKQENPKFDFRLIKLNQTTDYPVSPINISDTQNIINECAHDCNYHQVTYRQNERLIPNYTYIDELSSKQEKDFNLSSVLQNNGIYLITGGMGGIALTIAEYLLLNYNAHIILIGRRTISPEIKQRLRILEKNNGKVEYYSCNVSDKDSLTVLFKHTLKNNLNGIFHSAGITQDNFFINKNWQEFASTINPKIKGTILLDELSSHIPLDFFVTFSSLTAILGNIGQTDYAYGNSFMDNFMVKRANLVKSGKRFGHSISINWPYWQQGGMRLNLNEETQLKQNYGIEPISNQQAIMALESILTQQQGCFAVIAKKTEQVEYLLNTHKTLACQYPTNNSQNIAYHDKSIVEKEETSIQTNNEEIENAISLYFQNLFFEKLKIPKEKIENTKTFDHYGFDSIVMVDLINIMEEKFGALPKTLFFEYQSITELIEYFIENHSECFAVKYTTNKYTTENSGISKENNKSQSANNPVNFNTAPKTDQNDRNSKTGSEDIAIIGLTGCYPEAENLEEFWKNLQHGRDCISEIPLERWDYQDYFQQSPKQDGQTYSKWGGFIKHADKFDPLFFNISPKEAQYMDPQERLLLQSAWHVLEDAAYTPKQLMKQNRQVNKKVGVFVASMWSDYQLHGLQQPINHSSTPQSFLWSLANRISYFFGFTGPSLTVDTACSSSFTALHLACESIRRGECHTAITAAINLSLHPSKYNLLSRLKFLSTDGRSRSFGEGGDGYVPGEGVGAVLMKPFTQSISDNDYIYGVIKGVAINHGGRTHGFSVPNPAAQTEVIQMALENANIPAQTISYVEAHGTGTALGDPIEINGLNKAFSECKEHRCAIGSVKSNIGHLEAAAGLSGLTKVLLQLKHKKIAPSIHTEKLNTNIDFENSIFYIQDKLSSWPKPQHLGEYIPRRAGISSFGAGGANTHLIIEEYESINSTDLQKNNKPFLFILSAKDEHRLKEYINNFYSFIQKNHHKNNPSLNKDILLKGITIFLDKNSNTTIDNTKNWHENKLNYLTLSNFAHYLNTEFNLEVNTDIFSECSNIEQLALIILQKYQYQNDITKANNVTHSLTNISYTLMFGREVMDSRFACIVNNLDELLDILKICNEQGLNMGLPNSFITRTEQENLYKKLISDKEGSIFINTLIKENNLAKLATLWTNGIDIDWGLLNPEGRKVPLPLYPFWKNRYWINDHAKNEKKISYIPDRKPNSYIDNSTIPSSSELTNILQRLRNKSINIEEALSEIN